MYSVTQSDGRLILTFDRRPVWLMLLMGVIVTLGLAMGVALFCWVVVALPCAIFFPTVPLDAMMGWASLLALLVLLGGIVLTWSRWHHLGLPIIMEAPLIFDRSTDRVTINGKPVAVLSDIKYLRLIEMHSIFGLYYPNYLFKFDPDGIIGYFDCSFIFSSGKTLPIARLHSREKTGVLVQALATYTGCEIRYERQQDWTDFYFPWQKRRSK